MNPIYFTLERVKKEANKDLDRSKLLGSPVFPSDFLERNSISGNDYFIAQINLEELKEKDSLLPKEGFLYFFVDINTFEPKVIYTNEELVELCDDINNGFDKKDFGDTSALYMNFDAKEGSYLAGDIDPNLDVDMFIDTTDMVTLLAIDALTLPQDKKVLLFTNLAQLDGYYLFLINEEDLKNLDFSKVKFVDYGS